MSRTHPSPSRRNRGRAEGPSPSTRPGRAAAITAVWTFASVCYLVLRVAGTGSGWAAVLSWLLLVAEVWSVMEVAVVGVLATLARRSEPAGAANAAGSAVDTDTGADLDRQSIDVVVMATNGDGDRLERTLLALGATEAAGVVTVVLTAGDRRCQALCAELGTGFRVDHGSGHDPIATVLGFGRTDLVLWLEAGQIPDPSLIVELERHMADQGIAVAQSAVGVFNRESLRHQRGGRDDGALLREVTGPGMSALGAGPWTGPGCLLRRSAFVEIEGAATTVAGQLRLHQEGFRTAFDRRHLVRDAAPDDLEGYLDDRAGRAAVALGGWWLAMRPLRTRGLGVRHRFALSAVAAPYLAGMRQLIFVVALLGAIAFGLSPQERLDGPFVVAAGAWLLGGVLVRYRLTGGAMRVGDWTRQAWRGLGCDLVALTSVRGRSRRRRRAVPTVEKHGPVRVWSRLRLVTTLVVMVDVIVVARGLTTIGFGLLPPMGGPALVAAVVLIMGHLAAMVDVLQLVARRPQRRSLHRFAADFPVEVDGRPATAVDVSTTGLAVRLDHAPPVGGKVELAIGIDRLGRAIDLAEPGPFLARAEARHARLDDDGRVRLGLALIDLDDGTRRALLNHCLEAARRSDNGDVGSILPVPTAMVPGRSTSDRRLLRALTGAAAVGAASAVIYGPGAEPVRAAEPAALAVDDLCVSGEAPTDRTGERTDEQSDPAFDGAVRTWDGERWGPWTELDENGCGALSDTIDAIELTIDGGRFVTEPVEPGGGGDVSANGVVTVALSAVRADPGHEIEWIDSGTGWQTPPTDGRIVPGRVSVRLTDGSVFKLTLEPGEEVWLPSLDRGPLTDGEEGQP